jgi:hypothetical protein
MARHEKPPEGFAVAHLPDGRYYPLRVERCYSAQHPDGMLTLYPHSGRKGDDTASFALRGEALTFCRELAALNAEAQRGHFEHMAVESDCYPERCAWYRDLIEEVTGNPPQIIRWHRCIWVIVPGYFCPTCGLSHESICRAIALTVEEALAQAAEAVYAKYTCCCASSTPAQGVSQEGERDAS